MSTTQTTVERPTIDGETDAHEDGDEAALTEDQVFHLLQNDRRRNVLRYLQGREGTVRMRDIAEQVAAWEHDTTVQALTSKERQRVYIPLYQSHLPKLDEEGVIEYNQSRGIVERTPLADTLERYLDPLADDEPEDDDEDGEWNRYYLGATSTGGLLLGGSALGVPPLASLSGFLVAGIILTLFATLTAARMGME